MPTPTTLVQYAQQELAVYQAARSRAREELTTAQAALQTARQLLSDDSRSLADLEQQIARKRAALAATTIPADADALVIEITALLIASRVLQAAVVAGTDLAAETEAAVQDATGRLTRAGQQLEAAQAELVAAVADAARRQRWAVALAAPPLSQTRGNATNLRDDAGTLFDIAEQKVEAEIPEKLRDTARSRYEVETARIEFREDALAAAEALLVILLDSDGGVTGDVARRRIEFARAERRLAAYVERAVDRYNQALSQLRQLETGAILSPAEQARLADATLAAAGESAADLGTARDDARKEVDEKQAVLDDVRLQKQAEDPGADVESDADVQDARDELATARTARDTAQAAFEAEQAALRAWAAVVPDAAWRKVLGFIEAQGSLEYLRDTDPATLTTAVTNAETALAAALDDAARSLRSTAFLQDTVLLRQKQYDNARGNRQTRLLSAVRGDT